MIFTLQKLMHPIFADIRRIFTPDIYAKNSAILVTV